MATFVFESAKTFSKGSFNFLLLFILLFILIRFSHSSITVENGLVDSQSVKECNSTTPVDLVLVLDGSGSIGNSTFDQQIKFASELANRLNISSPVAVNGHRLAIIQYSEEPRLEIPLDHHTTHMDELQSTIKGIQFMGGTTNTGNALHFALSHGFRGARGGAVPKVLILLTDGQSQDDVMEAAQRLRDSYVLVYTVGITNRVNIHQLLQVSGNVLRVFTVDSFDQLDEHLADVVAWDLCRSGFRPGTPEIICGQDRIGVRAASKKPFEGYVFVQNHFHDKECRSGPERFADPMSIGITVPFSTCNVHRYRSLNPKGIYVETTVVFMFHPAFMTSIDQTVRVQCFYMEAEKNVSAYIGVNMMTTQFRENVYPLPRCEYTLRKDNPNGEIVHFALLGQAIYHRWDCVEENGRDAFGMLVHSCYVDNGYGDRVDVLDENGCGLDSVLLQTPDYDPSLRLATKKYHVFKYADRPVLQFQCQISLCLKLDGGCVGLTPPKCRRSSSPAAGGRGSIVWNHHRQVRLGAESPPPFPQQMPAAGGSRFKKSKMMTRQRDTNTIEEDDYAVLKVGKFKSPNTLDVFTRPFLVVEEQFAAPEDSSFLRCPIVPRKDINNKWLGFATASDDGNALLLILAGLLVFSLANIVAASVIFCGRWSGRFFVWKVEKDIVA